MTDWQLIKATGWTFPECRSAPAVDTDWFLQIDAAMNTPIEGGDD